MKKDKKKLAIAIGMKIALIASVGGIFAYNRLAEPEAEWPYSAIGYAEEVSLTEAVTLLGTEGDGRRAAIVGETVYIERVAGAGDDTEALEESFTEKAEREKAAKKATKSETDESVSTQEAPELDVVRANISSWLSDFAERHAETSTFDIQVFDEKGGPDAGAIFEHVMRILFLGLIGTFLFVMLRGNLPGGGGKDLVHAKDLKTGLDDVAGIDLARGDIEEIIGLIKNPEKAGSLGARLPRGVLLDGPPGTGKTLLARAMAKEAGVAFLKTSGSDFSKMFVGQGGGKVRSVFKTARKHAPCIIFIDELDSVGRARGNGGGSGADQERETILNALLTELDGFDPREGVFLIAATNRPELLDKALTRPGRIDQRITMRLPDIKGREDVLMVHSKKVPLAEGVTLRAIAETTYGFSPADLENLVNQAALAAGRAGRKRVEAGDFAEARNRIMLPRASAQLTLEDDERQLTAVHEAGHALVAALNPHADPIETVTIAPQGPAAGFVLQAPDRDRVFETFARLKARIQVAVAGREAERLVFGAGHITTGAASDIRQATHIAREMVTTYGMSDLGFIVIDPNDPVLYDTSNSPLKTIQKIIAEEQAAVAVLLEEHRASLDELTNTLLDRETIPGSEVYDCARRVQEALPAEAIDTDAPLQPRQMVA